MNVALILSGGIGTRFGGNTPKQYLLAGGRMLITWTAERLWASRRLDGLQIVAAERWQMAIRKELPAECVFLGFSQPGGTRQESIRNGLRDLAAHGADFVDAVLIHDAARPLVSPALVSACFAALPGHDGVLPVLPMTDTVYESDGGTRVEGLLDRSHIFAGQAPELFRFGPYFQANEALPPAKLREIRGSTEPAVLAGLDVVMIPGSRENIKVTMREDLERCRELLRNEKA